MADAPFPEARLEFGIFDWIEDSGREPYEILEHKLALIEAADKQDFYGWHLAEHTGTPLSLDGSPAVLLASAIQRTQRIRLGALTFCLPWHNPYRFYNEICMLDHLSRGRVELGVGRGVSAVESAYYGIDSLEESRERYRETLDIYMKACASRILNFDGTYFKYHDLELYNRPYQRPYPPLWFPSSSRDSIEFIASHGYNTVFNFEDANEVRALCEQYRETWLQHKDEPGRHNAHVATPMLGKRHHIVIADTDSEAEAIAAPAYAAWNAHIGYLGQRTGRTAATDPAAPRRRPRGMIAGSAKTVAQRLAEYIKTSTINYAVATFSFGDLAPEQAMRSLDAFATEVIPAIRSGAA